MRVRVARIGKPFGVRGAVTVQVFTDEPEQRFQPGARFFTTDDESGPFRGASLTLADVHRHGARWTLQIEGVTDRNGAEELRGTQLFVESSAEPHAADGESWYPAELIGLPVRGVDGQDYGAVVAVEHSPAHDLLVVRTPAGYVARVPLVRAIVPQIDGAGVRIDPPRGLMTDIEETPDAD